MGNLDPLTKYDFEGIGKASSVALWAALASTPAAAVTTGIFGQFLFAIATRIFAALASVGLVLLNIGMADLEVISQQHQFDGSLDDAFKIINQKGANLTDAERASIDANVIAAFKDFASFGG